MDQSDNYNYQEHLHRYAVWTAARAQRNKFASNSIISNAIKNAELRSWAFSLDFDMGGPEFDKLHNLKTSLLQTILTEEEETVAYGRAAKIINIYLKTTLVIPNCNSDYSLIKNIHPPIDSILLKGLCSKNIISQEFKNEKWTNLSADIYKKLIAELRSRFAELWKAERFWNINEDENEN